MIQAIGNPDKPTINAIAKALEPSTGTTLVAAQALASFGFEARSAIPALNLAYAHKERYTRQAVQDALDTLHATRATDALESR